VTLNVHSPDDRDAIKLRRTDGAFTVYGSWVLNSAEPRMGVVITRQHARRRGVAVSLEVTVRGITIPPDELSWRFSRSQGPGGQSVNTTDSQAELSFDLAKSAALPPALKERAVTALAGRLSNGVLTIAASEYRSQLRNREAAAARLSALLTEATAPPRQPRRQTKPTRGAVERRLAEKQRRSQLKRQRRFIEE